MTKYVRGSKSQGLDDEWYGPTMLADITVFEPEQKQRYTGLLFPDGNEVMAIDREPIGFVRFE